MGSLKTQVRASGQSVPSEEFVWAAAISAPVGGTSISGAIDFSLHLLTTIPVPATRQVIDISGDGINDHGHSVTRARDEAVYRGVTINGLPIRLDRSEEASGSQAWRSTTGTA